MNIKLLEPYLAYIFGGIIVLLGLVIRTYFQERAKLRALRSENRALVTETEKIKASYSRELEELKKEHQLDISKRKYQYESKKEHYINFFKLLDQFTQENSNNSQAKLLAILDEFNKNYLCASANNKKKNETAAVTVMSKKIQQLVFDANQDLLRIEQETNTIRMVASDTVIAQLDALTAAYDASMVEGNRMMNELSALMTVKNTDKIKEGQCRVAAAGNVVNQIKKETIRLMRKELNEI